MIKSSELWQSHTAKRYGLGGTFAITLLFWGLFQPITAGAQPHCDALRQRMYEITSSEASQIPDSLRMVLDLATSVRACKEAIPVGWEAWLMNNEVFVLDALERYEEAAGVVDHFFEAYFDDATDYYRARFYLWQLHLSALAGDVLPMVAAYTDAQRYAEALDRHNRAHFYLNGAFAYSQIKEYETALALAEKARGVLGRPETYEDSVALARAVHAGAEAQLHSGRDLVQAKEDFRTAARLYGVLGDTAHVATATTLLGEAYAADGDTVQALNTMETGVLLARTAGAARSRVYALFRQGQLLEQWGDLDAAEQSLLKALEASENVQEFALGIAYQLAVLYDERDQLKRATSYYQAVIDAPRPGDFAEALEAERKQQQAYMRLLLIDNKRQRTRFYITFAGLLLLMAGGAVLFVIIKRRMPSLIEKKSTGVYLPRRLKTGKTLDELEQYFQQIADSRLFGRRLARIFAVLFVPDLVLPYIEEAYLARQVEADNIASNVALFQCAAAVEIMIDNQTFQGKAENTMRSYLSGEFGKRSWPWPTHPVVWKRFFLEYHAKELLKEED